MKIYFNLGLLCLEMWEMERREGNTDFWPWAHTLKNNGSDLWNDWGFFFPSSWLRELTKGRFLSPAYRVWDERDRNRARNEWSLPGSKHWLWKTGLPEISNTSPPPSKPHLNFHTRNPEQTFPRYVTLACGLFQTKVILNPEGSQETYTTPLTT